MDIKLDFANSFIVENELNNLKASIELNHNQLHLKTGAGSDFLGWIDLPKNYDDEEFKRIKRAAEKIRDDSDVFIIIGIGGSYLGTRACVEALTHSFYNLVSKNGNRTPEIYFVGNNISSTYYIELMDVIKDKDISINVISKSGTTTEPAIAFRIFKEYMENKYGKEMPKVEYMRQRTNKREH